MKMNTKLVLVLTFMLVVSSCYDSDIIVENANSGISIDDSLYVHYLKIVDDLNTLQ